MLSRNGTLPKLLTAQLIRMGYPKFLPSLNNQSKKNHPKVAKRKKLWGARKAQEVAGSTCATYRSDGVKAGPQHEEGFATATEKATGKSKASTNRAAKRAHDVCQEARDLIRGTKLDTGTMLDKQRS